MIPTNTLFIVHLLHECASFVKWANTACVATFTKQQIPVIEWSTVTRNTLHVLMKVIANLA
jgi:hypothetical protein